MKPSLIISIGLMILLYLSGGISNNINYLIIFLTINSMSIFFSVHYLIMYYLMQPYNLQSEIVDSKYKLVYFLTYLVVFYTFDMKLTTLYY